MRVQGLLTAEAMQQAEASPKCCDGMNSHPLTESRTGQGLGERAGMSIQ